MISHQLSNIKLRIKCITRITVNNYYRILHTHIHIYAYTHIHMYSHSHTPSRTHKYTDKYLITTIYVS